MKTIYLLACLLCILLHQQANAQCNGIITTFPYNEDFESTNGGFTPGGTNSDWSWGAPIKPIINGAGSGTKCWITGGLAASSYTNAQNSFLQSPCFNFSSLQYPLISFKVFWETERRFDGASLQYSIDNGNNWITLGTDNNPDPCIATNWFNTPAITYLGGTKGWSGTTLSTSGSCLGGNGSAAWVTAKHDISFLAGQPSVMFRFTFGAGTTCNSYDGFAIDDFNIREAPPNTSDFNYTCSGTRTVSFTDNSSPCVSTYDWNFGDPASGANNTSTEANPVHQFTAGGTYNVTLTVAFQGGLSLTTSKSITVLDATVNTTNVQCWGNANGSASVTVTGGNGNYTYAWNTDPVRTTSSITNLVAGNYVVNITSAGACAVSLTAEITQPPQLTATLHTRNEKCSKQNGEVRAWIQGGVVPYSYLWTTGRSDTFITNLSAGPYGVTVTDANGCRVSASTFLKNDNNNLQLFLGNDTTICPGEKLVLNAGNFETYQWQDNSSASSFTVTQTGSYSVKVTDTSGCTASDSITVTVDCSDIYFPSAFTPNNDNKNDAFGAIGNVGAVKNFSLKVYSRWGDVLFETKNPYYKWNGNIKGMAAPSGVFVWFAAYEINGRKMMQKGSFVLIR